MKRGECEYCGSSMEYRGKSEETHGSGHHRSLFYCSECDERRYRG